MANTPSAEMVANESASLGSIDGIVESSSVLVQSMATVSLTRADAADDDIRASISLPSTLSAQQALAHLDAANENNESQAAFVPADPLYLYGLEEISADDTAVTNVNNQVSTAALPNRSSELHTLAKTHTESAFTAPITPDFGLSQSISTIAADLDDQSLVASAGSLSLQAEDPTEAPDVNNSTTLGSPTHSEEVTLAETNPDEVFRFTDLPLEIRQEIYQELVCDYEPHHPITPRSISQKLEQILEDDTDAIVPITFCRCKVYKDVLYLNKAVYKEAHNHMLKTNLFVKVVFDYCHNSIRIPLVTEQLPCRALFNDDNKEAVLIHHVTTKDAQELVEGQENRLAYILFQWKHMDKWIKIIEEFTSTRALQVGPDEERRILHTVTLVDPSSKYRLATDPPFFTTELQEKLLAPFRQLRGMTQFAINGVSPELSAAAVHDITLAPWFITVVPSEKTLEAAAKASITDPLLMPSSPQSEVLAHIEDLRTQGSTAYATGDLEKASDIWSTATLLMTRNLRSNRSAYLFHPIHPSGLTFANTLCNLHFKLTLNRVQIYLTKIRIIMSVPSSPLSSNTTALIHETIYQGLIFNLVALYNHTNSFHLYYKGAETWRWSRTQQVKMVLKIAIACRLGGTKEDLQRAGCILVEGLRKYPDTDALKREFVVVREAILVLEAAEELNGDASASALPAPAS